MLEKTLHCLVPSEEFVLRFRLSHLVRESNRLLLPANCHGNPLLIPSGLGSGDWGGEWVGGEWVGAIILPAFRPCHGSSFSLHLAMPPYPVEIKEALKGTLHKDRIREGVISGTFMALITARCLPYYPNPGLVGLGAGSPSAFSFLPFISLEVQSAARRL